MGWGRVDGTLRETSTHRATTRISSSTNYLRAS